ncbi:APC family permease [Ktedonobacteria bacterium brp13]|nr:APC family permease [Ktedonobacteria bacterium brp13]
MAQESVAQDALNLAQQSGNEHAEGSGMLGPLLCWAVVFADIGTSVYYTPGILYQTVQGLAGFFVFLTMFVFILLTLKYTEVTHRYPQGGGVVTVAAQALNPWFGALGGMFILVDYFLTAATSSLSGVLYLGVVFPPLLVHLTTITVAFLLLLGIINWYGVKESAKLSFVGAVIAFLSDIAILVTVFSHISLGEFFYLISKMFVHPLAPGTLVTGFAGAFLAFSGLESISQLSPVMKLPHKKIAGQAMLLVVLTIGITSPLLTLLSTQLLPGAANNTTESAQIISLLAGKWGGPVLMTEVAISAGALLIFASNTAIIGAYHVFLALARMDFMPQIVLKRNKVRDTPHVSIALATGIPIAVLIAVQGRIDLLGELYAFGLLGAFTLTCLGLDIVRYRDLKRARALNQRDTNNSVATLQQGDTDGSDGSHGNLANIANQTHPVEVHELMKSNALMPLPTTQQTVIGQSLEASEIREAQTLWFKINFTIGILTTVLVSFAWCTNLIAKPLATAFGSSVAAVGMIIAFIVHTRQNKEGKVPVPVVITRIEEAYPNSTLAVLAEGSVRNSAVIRAAINNASTERPLVFLYLAHKKPRQAPRMMEIIDPYLEDQEAKDSFSKAESLAIKAHIPDRTYIYLQEPEDIVSQVWQSMHPRDTLFAFKNEDQIKDINPDRIRYEVTPDGRVAHFLKRW